MRIGGWQLRVKQGVKLTKKIVYHARKASKLILLITYKIKRIQKEHLLSFDNMCHRLGSEK